MSDAHALQEAAHQLKGAAATIGTVKVTALCRTIEDAASAGTIPELETLEQLEVEYERAAHVCCRRN